MHDIDKLKVWMILKFATVLIFKGAMCNIYNDLFTEMQYNIHNYVFRGV